MVRRIGGLCGFLWALSACGGSTPPPQQSASGTKTSSAAAPRGQSGGGGGGGGGGGNRIFYTVTSAGHVAGSATVSLSASEMKVSYNFNDRGRGPNLMASAALGPDGAIKKLEIKGVSYFKVPVDETASFEGSNVQWSSAADRGSRTTDGKAIYVPFESVPPFDGVIAKTLLHAPDQKLPFLPGGEGTIKKVTDLEITSRSGKLQTVSLYHITGLDFGPSPIWLDRDELLFFEGSEWGGIIRSGFEENMAALISAQNTAEAERTAAIAKELAHTPKGPLAIKHARLFDVEKKKVMPGTTVIVEGYKITFVGPDNKAKIPKNAEVIDARGRTMLPGLFDMHVHLVETDGLLDIANGVTTVRDLANDPDKLISMKKRWHEGSAIGPRVLMAGIIDGPGPWAGPTKVLVDTASAAKAAVDMYADRGFVQVKVYSSVAPSLVPTIIQEAKARKLRVSGHVPAFMRAEDVVKSGFDEIQHANFLFLNFIKDVDDTRGPVRFTAVAEHAAKLNLRGKDVKNFINLLKTKKIVVDPTLNIFETLFTARTGTMAAFLAPVADRLPVQVARTGLRGGLPVPEGMDKTYRDSFTAMEKLVKELHDAGVTIVAGTDSIAGIALHRELELYAEAGIPTKDVLALATIGAAHVMHFERELGSVSKGKRADFFLVDGDPLADMKAIRRIELVVKNGLIFKPAELDQVLGIKP